MIYASISNGKVITDKARLARVETDRDIKEIKVPGNYSHGTMFNLGERVRFKRHAPSWHNRIKNHATA